MKFVLISEKTERPMRVGNTVTNNRGEKFILKGWSEPYDADLIKAGFVGDVSTLNPFRGARIYVVPKADADDFQNNWSQYFPSVCGLRFVIKP